MIRTLGLRLETAFAVGIVACIAAGILVVFFIIA
jgi:hypothetical protein